jgi:hypothetical protein
VILFCNWGWETVQTKFRENRASGSNPEIEGDTKKDYLKRTLFSSSNFRVSSGYVGTRQAMYVQCNIEVRSCNHCCSGKAISFTYSECVFTALSSPACNMHAVYCHLWPARLYSIFLNSHKQQEFKKKVTEHQMCILIFSATFVRNISLYKKISARYDHKCILVLM